MKPVVPSVKVHTLSADPYLRTREYGVLASEMEVVKSDIESNVVDHKSELMENLSALFSLSPRRAAR